MKYILTILALLLVAPLWAQEEGRLTNEEKSEISDHLNQSRNKLEALVENLSQEQWHHKTVDSVWSIAEIAEHLEKSERQLFSLTQSI